MAWVKLDDKLYSNPKLSAAGLGATGLYARALSYCGAQLTDGFVPEKWARLLADGDETLVAALSEHGLWETVGSGSRRRVTRADTTTIDVVFKAAGYFIRDYLTMNPSRAEAQRSLSEASARARAAAEKRWEKTRAEQEQHANGIASGSDSAMRSSNAPSRPLLLKERAHTREDQPGKTAFECPECGQAYGLNTPEQLAEHLEHVHWIVREEAR